MKKIVLFVSSVCLAFGMQAASVAWNIKNVKGPDGNALAGSSEGQTPLHGFGACHCMGSGDG